MARITAPEPDLTPDRLRREAKTLRRASRAGEPGALYRLRTVLPKADPQRLRHADALHVVAREHGFASWPKLKLSAELHGLDRAAAAQRLGLALQLGQAAVAEALLVRMPDLPQGFFGLQVALYDIDAVRAALAREPKLATDVAGTKRPILHLAFSRWIKARPDLETEMLAVAEALVAAGADVNDGFGSEKHSWVATQQLVVMRQYLDSIGHDSKPIWITELGLHWGYDGMLFSGQEGYDNSCDPLPQPSGSYQTQAVIGYLDAVFDWLDANAASKNIEKWFLLSTYENITTCNASAYAGLTLFDGPNIGANLTAVGQFFRDRVLGISP